MFHLDSYFFGVGSTMLPSSRFLIRASSTSSNVINIILRLSDCVIFNGFTDPLLTVAVRGKSIWVHTSLTPLRIPPDG